MLERELDLLAVYIAVTDPEGGGVGNTLEIEGSFLS